MKARQLLVEYVELPLSSLSSLVMLSNMSFFFHRDSLYNEQPLLQGQGRVTHTHLGGLWSHLFCLAMVVAGTSLCQPDTGGAFTGYQLSFISSVNKGARYHIIVLHATLEWLVSEL